MVAHTPVLVDEVLELFKPRSGDILLDATLGHGGHARAYLVATAPEGKVLGIDADPQAVTEAARQLQPFGHRVVTRRAHFAYLKDSITGGGIVEEGKSSFDKQPPELVPWLRSNSTGFSHILFDLGMGSHQLADPERGFSFTSDRGLSMRYGTDTHLPPAQLASLNQLEQRRGHVADVADILAHTTTCELAEIIYTYGGERFRGRIAKALKDTPYPTTAAEMADRIVRAVPGVYRRGRLHPATRTFQALRLAVNRELESLTTALPQAYDLLAPGGVVAVISFHSLEDRIVKNTFRRYADVEGATVLTKKPMRAGAAERVQNPRARSAKLRALQKT